MQVCEYYKFKDNIIGPIKITGHLVLIENELILVDSSEIDDFKNAKGIKASDQSLKYVLRDALLPLGGDSSIFHKATLFGVIEPIEVPTIQIQQMKIQERGSTDWLNVNMNNKHIEHCKTKYEPDDGFDFFKEMGD